MTQPEVVGLKSRGEVDKGRFSTVYLYESTNTGRKVVIKFVPAPEEKAEAEIEKAKGQMRAEEEALRSLQEQGKAQRLVGLIGPIQVNGREGLILEALHKDAGWQRLDRAVENLDRAQAAEVCRELVNLYRDLEAGESLDIFEIKAEHIFINLTDPSMVKGIDLGADVYGRSNSRRVYRRQQLANLIAFVLSGGKTCALPGHPLTLDEAARTEQEFLSQYAGLLARVINGDMTAALATLATFARPVRGEKATEPGRQGEKEVPAPAPPGLEDLKQTVAEFDRLRQELQKEVSEAARFRQQLQEQVSAGVTGGAEDSKPKTADSTSPLETPSARFHLTLGELKEAVEALLQSYLQRQFDEASTQLGRVSEDVKTLKSTDPIRAGNESVDQWQQLGSSILQALDREQKANLKAAWQHLGDATTAARKLARADLEERLMKERHRVLKGLLQKLHQDWQAVNQVLKKSDASPQELGDAITKATIAAGEEGVKGLPDANDGLFQQSGWADHAGMRRDMTSWPMAELREKLALTNARIKRGQAQSQYAEAAKKLDQKWLRNKALLLLEEAISMCPESSEDKKSMKKEQKEWTGQVQKWEEYHRRGEELFAAIRDQGDFGRARRLVKQIEGLVGPLLTASSDRHDVLNIKRLIEEHRSIWEQANQLKTKEHAAAAERFETLARAFGDSLNASFKGTAAELRRQAERAPTIRQGDEKPRQTGGGPRPRSQSGQAPTGTKVTARDGGKGGIMEWFKGYSVGVRVTVVVSLVVLVVAVVVIVINVM